MMSILATTGVLDTDLSATAFLGEISLSGDLRPVRGVLPMILDCKEHGVERVFIPFDNAAEGKIAEGVDVFPAKNVKDIYKHLKGGARLQKAVDVTVEARYEPISLSDMSDIKGQEGAKRAFEVAAVGGHNLIMVGPPGSGKSMLAKRISSILPPMSHTEQIAVTKIHSVMGMLNESGGLITRRPFRAPHHTVSAAGMVGGGHSSRPGEVSLAHNGVLFLDELSEYGRAVTEALRQPLEDRQITISRANSRVTYPSTFMMVAAMNPCPCGFYGHPTRECICGNNTISRYLGRVSGPLLDRMDIHLEIAPVDYASLSDTSAGERSETILERVTTAREFSQTRMGEYGVTVNSLIPPSLLQKMCPTTPKANELLKSAFERLNLSARGYDRILKVSRSIADLDLSELIEEHHILEAIQYRNLDRKYWGMK